MSGMVRRLPQNMPEQGIASFGDCPSMDGFATRVFTGDQTRVCHELSRALEPPQVSRFGHDGDGRQKSDAPQALKTGD